MTLDIPLRKKLTGQKIFSFLGPKKCLEINQSVKNIKTLSSFMHALKKCILLHLET